jgi:hypothetical protein
VRPSLVALDLAEDPQDWAALGFAVEDGRCRIGATELRLRGGDGGITGWTLAGLAGTELDGLATAVAEPADGPAPAHPNGVVGIDHVVVSTPDTARTFAALAAAGMELRGTRVAGTARQGFLLLREALVEVVGPQVADGTHPAAFWGLTLVTRDLDGAARLLGDRLGAVKDAVQPGRRIATVRADAAGVRVPLALMTPRLRPH